MLLLLLRSLQVKSSGGWGEAGGGVGVGTMKREVWVGEREIWVREREVVLGAGGRGKGQRVTSKKVQVGRT